MNDAERIAAALALHQPTRDSPFSLLDWEFCSCGAMEVFTAPDGIPALGPAKYPCATVRALTQEG